MNFLAHAYLSFGDPDVLMGNMIADLVKGKQIELYPKGVQRGIHIHRQIDAFTDNHPVTHQTAEVFRTSTGKYAGAFLDVAYDHFLALDEQNIPEGGWHAFSERSYDQIQQYGEIFPEKFLSMFMYMRSEDWFYNYRYNWMIERSFERLKNRASYLDDNAPVFEEFEQHYKTIESGYNAFFPELKAYIREVSQTI
jgi:acyl carrier protein phosphodiesterase